MVILNPAGVPRVGIKPKGQRVRSTILSDESVSAISKIIKKPVSVSYMKAKAQQPSVL